MVKPNYFRIMACAAVLALFGCSQESGTAVTSAASAVQTAVQNEFAQNLPQNAPVIYVTTNATYPPYEFWDEYGNITGFDVDMINAIAADQGMRVIVRHVVWKDAFNSIAEPSADSNQVVMGAMSVTPERLAAYELSREYAQSPVSVVVAADSGIKNLMDLNGSNIAIVDGSTALDKLTDAKVTGFTRSGTSSAYLSFKKLANQEADAAADDKLTLQYHLAHHPEFDAKLIDIPSDNDAIVFATNKGNTALMAKINQGLDNIRANGTYDKIIRKWFGKQTSSQTAAVSASQP